MTSDTLPDRFDGSHYVPIVLTRRGERNALGDIQDETKARMTPLFVVHPIGKNPRTGAPTSVNEPHLANILKDLLRTWGTRPAFADLMYLDEADLAGGVPPIEWFLSAAHSAGLSLAPVLNSRSSPSYRSSAISSAQALGLGICFRLPIDEWADLGTPIGNARLLSLIAETGRGPQDIHLVIDVGTQVTDPPQLTAGAVRSALVGLPHIEEWKSLTVCGTGMPTSTSEVGADSEDELPRLEWFMWKLLRALPTRVPTFGDYGIQSSDPLSDFNPLLMQSSAQLRYTIANSWFVARGRSTKKNGLAQIHAIAQKVTQHPQFSGRDFSAGDMWMSDCAVRATKASNQEMWRRVTTNHHFEFVVTQIAILHGE